MAGGKFSGGRPTKTSNKEIDPSMMHRAFSTFWGKISLKLEYTKFKLCAAPES